MAIRHKMATNLCATLRLTARIGKHVNNTIHLFWTYLPITTFKIVYSQLIGWINELSYLFYR